MAWKETDCLPQPGSIEDCEDGRKIVVVERVPAGSGSEDPADHVPDRFGLTAEEVESIEWSEITGSIWKTVTHSNGEDQDAEYAYGLLPPEEA